MEYVTLNNGVQMPVLGLGTFRATGGDCARSVRAAIAAGYRLIDTAEAYGNEEEVGRGIREGGVSRSELFLTTKVNFRSYERARETVEASLRKLGTDYLDLVLLHWPFGHYYAAWEALEALCEAGTIRAIGVSNFDADRLVDLVSFHRVTPAVDQIETHLFCQRRKERPWLEKYGVHHMAYAPLGRDRAGEMFALPEVRSLAEKYGKTPAQILLRFLTQQGISAVPKSVHEERIRENIDLFDFSLTESELETLRRLDRADPRIGTAEDPVKVETAMTW